MSALPPPGTLEMDRTAERGCCPYRLPIWNPSCISYIECNIHNHTDGPHRPPAGGRKAAQVLSPLQALSDMEEESGFEPRSPVCCALLLGTESGAGFTVLRLVLLTDDLPYRPVGASRGHK